VIDRTTDGSTKNVTSQMMAGGQTVTESWLEHATYPSTDAIVRRTDTWCVRVGLSMTCARWRSFHICTTLWAPASVVAVTLWY